MTTPSQFARSLVSLSEDEGIERAVESFLSFVKRRKIAHMLPSIVEELERMVARKREEDTVHIEVAQETPQELLRKIALALGAQQGDDVSVTHNDMLLGGFRGRFRGMLYDASLEGKVQRLEEKLKSF